MFCIKCGGLIPNEALVCPHCGTPVQSENVASSEKPIPVQQTMAPKAVAGFICSILGMVICLLPFVNLALSIVGTSLCKKSSNVIKENPASYTGSSLASIGYIFGIIGIVLNSTVVFATLIWIVFMGGGLFTFISTLLTTLQ